MALPTDSMSVPPSFAALPNFARLSTPTPVFCDKSNILSPASMALFPRPAMPAIESSGPSAPSTLPRPATDPPIPLRPSPALFAVALRFFRPPASFAIPPSPVALALILRMASIETAIDQSLRSCMTCSAARSMVCRSSSNAFGSSTGSSVRSQGRMFKSSPIGPPAPMRHCVLNRQNISTAGQASGSALKCAGSRCSATRPNTAAASSMSLVSALSPRAQYLAAAISFFAWLL
jgi:hypothetical protein